MSSRLAILRSQLAHLRRARAAARAAAAWSALASGVVLALAGVFILDWMFGLAISQRVIVLLFAAIAVGWTYWRFTRPLLGSEETEIDVALIVDRQQRMNSDLVAALQFERPEAARWGSPQLAGAVVDRFAALEPRIDVFQGFSREQMRRRLSLLAMSMAVALAAAAVWPEHFAAFVNRLYLGSMHYPTRTQIEQIVINGAPVLPHSWQRATPVDCKAAQGRPLRFLVQCGGELPADGTVHLTATGTAQGRARLALKPLSLDERRARLGDAIGKLNDAIRNAPGAIQIPWREEILSLIRFDAPDAVAGLLSAKTHSDLTPVAADVMRELHRWPGEHHRTAILAGELGRLNDDLTYKVAVGDAFSDSAAVRMIPLPIIELEMNSIPPKYAAAGDTKFDSSGRQMAVLEGSSIELAVRCVNGKPLASAWLLLHKPDRNMRFDLLARDEQRLVWTTRPGGSPLESIREELRYEIQVIDADGLSLELPIRGSVRIRPDQPPTGVTEVVHKVVLPTAEPVISYRASDDYGISRLAIVVDVERGTAIGTSTVQADNIGSARYSETPAIAAAATESHKYEILTLEEPVAGEQLPLAGQYPIQLSPLALVKGDRLKLTLEVTDYRGENHEGRPLGIAQRCDPVVLEVSDEAGVLAAISQPDQRSSEQLSEIIKRQLGIGEER